MPHSAEPHSRVLTRQGVKMNFNIHVTRHAYMDMQEALNYIAYKKFNPDAAESLQDDIEAMGRSLVEYPGKYPGKYPFVPDEVLRNWGIRFVMVKEYYMFYTIRGNTIYFVRFLHRRRDWFSILRTGISLE
jgi:plasmid stabilization system protein ParE